MKHSEFCVVLQETILNTMRFLTFSLALLFISFIGLSAQDVRDVELATTKDKIIVTYNLFGKKNKDYQVDLLFKKPDGSEIRPKALTGDIGKKVQSGKGKSIVWDLYKDIDELSGSIEPIIKVQEPIQKPVSNAQKVSTKKFNRKKNNTIRTVYKIAWGKTRVSANQNSLAYDRKKGLETGFGVRWNAAKSFYIQPELLYKKHVYKQDVAGANQEINLHTNKLHYVKGQLMFGISPFNGGLYFNAGPYASHMFAARRKIQTNTDSNTINLFETGNPFDKLDYGYSLGASLDLNRGGFVFGFLFSEGLNNIIDNEAYTDVITNNSLELKNRSYNFYVTFGF